MEWGPYLEFIHLNYQKVENLFPINFNRHLKLLRLKKCTTEILGPKYRPNHYNIVLDITYDCNLKCFNCNRSCGLAPSDNHMSIKQIKKFIKESNERDRKWESIILAGGEPTLNPHILRIVDLLLQYTKNTSPDTKLVIVTNGYGDKPKSVLLSVPDEVEIWNTGKKSRVQKDFVNFNIAPCDYLSSKNIDYSNGCWVTGACGIGLTDFGYYFCAIAGGIDRVFGFDIGRKKMPASGDMMKEQSRILCKYCGHFARESISDRFQIFGYSKETVNGQENISPTWTGVYKKYRRRRPSISSY